jgi:glutamyl-Q tRNA(Asp) synthetase
LAAPLDAARPLPTLLQVMRFLGQDAPPELADGSIEDFWSWAVTHWDMTRVPRVAGIVVESLGS